MKIENKITVILTLNLEEATWLKNTVQNPIRRNESEKDLHIRKGFWEALSKEINICD